MNGYTNRATWLFNLHSSDWVANNAEDICTECSASWDGSGDPETEEEFFLDLKINLHDVIRHLLDNEVGELMSQAEDMIQAEGNLFIADMIDVQHIFGAINTRELADIYADEYVEGLKCGDFTFDLLDIARANEKAAREKVGARTKSTAMW